MRLTSLSKIIQVLLLLSGTPLNASNCIGLDQSTQSNLITYVKHRWYLPETADLRITVCFLVGDTRYWRITFKTPGEPRFSVSLYLTPDQRFLTGDLLDTKIDPQQEDSLKRRVLNEDLRHGSPPAVGTRDTRVKLTVFSDFQCPFSREAARVIEREALTRVGSLVRLEFRHLPLSSHSWARTVAERGACVHSQSNDAFWRFHDAVFERQSKLNDDNIAEELDRVTRELPDIDFDKVNTCVRSGFGSTIVQSDIDIANRNGIESTPFIVINGYKIARVPDPEALLTAIKEVESISPKK